MNPLQREPIISSGAITTLVEAGLLMAISLGILDITDDQVGQIMAFAIAVLGVVAPLWWARQNSTSVHNPHDVDGEMLVKMGGALPVKVQERAMAERGRA